MDFMPASTKDIQRCYRSLKLASRIEASRKAQTGTCDGATATSYDNDDRSLKNPLKQDGHILRQFDASD